MKLRTLNRIFIVVLTAIGIAAFSVTAAPAACPVISRSVPAFASSDYPANANDNNYSTCWRGAIPGWIAYDLSAVPAGKRGQVVVAWYDTDTLDYDPAPRNSYYNGFLQDYTIQGNAATGGAASAPTSGWVTLATVTGNSYRSRQSVVNLTGYNWIRLNISTLKTQGGTNTCINVDVHDASQGAQDDWIFLGDSITAGGLMVAGDNTFAQMINTAKPGYFPVAECGGIAGAYSWQGAQYINSWLAVFPGKYVGIAYGTNDAGGDTTGAAAYYTYEETIVKAVLAAGKVPVVSKIFYSTNASYTNYLPSYNAQIDALYAAYPQIIKGPDFWTFFKNNPSLLGSDGIHPSDAGYVAMRQEWANVALASIYNGGTNTLTPTTSPSPTARVTSTPTSRPNLTPTVTPTPTIRATTTPTPTRRRSVTVTPTPTRRRTATTSPTVRVTSTPTPTTRTSTPTPTNPGAAYIVVSYVIQSDWGTGATISVTITNQTAFAVNGWTLAFTFPGNQTITNLWSGTYTQSGASASVKDGGFNATIPANGGSVNFGFNLNYSGTNAKPTSYTLNGTACQVQ